MRNTIVCVSMPFVLAGALWHFVRSAIEAGTNLGERLDEVITAIISEEE